MTVDEAVRRRRKAERRGHGAERLAALALRAKGFRIVARRYRTKLGEIDIIARKGDLVAFVEVKARRLEQAAVDAVSYSAQARIRAAGDLWLSRQPDAARLSLRYDIVAVRPWRWPVHLADAF
ncbi:MAG: YraN family protein [Pararhizobium sp.]